MGEPIKRNQVANLSEVELLARTIYGEVVVKKTADLSDGRFEAIAWTIENRRTLKVRGNKYYGDSFKTIVTAPSCYVGLYDGGLKPDTSSLRWKKSLEIARKMVANKNKDMSKERAAMLKAIHNPIDRRRQFLMTGTFKSKGKSKIINIGGNSFFHYNVEGY